MATVITLSEACPIIYGHELPENVREDYDYISDDELPETSFFKIEGVYHCISDFVKSDTYAAQGFHGIAGETAFSSILIGVIDGDSDHLKVGRVCS
ncbi:hypothetical protein [Pseudomonas phage UF_RH7]|nr:hypothetical protein [Pseudomonas phage UF_RH7]